MYDSSAAAGSRVSSTGRFCDWRALAEAQPRASADAPESAISVPSNTDRKAHCGFDNCRSRIRRDSAPLPVGQPAAPEGEKVVAAESFPLKLGQKSTIV